MGVFGGGRWGVVVWGSNPTPLLGFFFSLLGFLSNNPKNPKFFLFIQKISNPQAEAYPGGSGPPLNIFSGYASERKFDALNSKH